MSGVPHRRRRLATLTMLALAVAGIGCRRGGPAPAGGGDGEQGPPNIVLVLVDTLRADHLQPYGYGRPTTPNVDALLASRGVVVERAYAPSPWTLPSVTALMTSLPPGEALPHAPASFAIDPSLPLLQEQLAGLGYDTAGWVANPTVHAGLGFSRGFATFHTPLVEEGVEEGADRVSALAAAWLRGHQRRPFFLYAHFMDPHDPYDNPDVVNGRSPFDAAQLGELSGRWVHGIFLGKVPLRDPPTDVRHLTALYDAEVHYFDRFLPALLAPLDEATRRRTLFVLTADHGEELHDHGGWKHGRTLYEEQLRAPLVLRWDGHLRAGTRLPGPVRLIDVAPTLLAAAGGRPPARWQGRNLLPQLRGEAAVPTGPIFATHLADGPRRAAVIARRWKLILFDRAAAFEPANELESICYHQELARLQRIELYDLAHDPAERRNLAGSRPDVVARLGPLVQAQLARERPGLRVLLAGAPQGARVEIDLRGDGRLAGWRSLWLGENDRVDAAGARLRLSLEGEALPKGVLLLPATRVGAVTARGLPGVVIRLGSGTVYGGGPIPEGSLAHAGWPGRPGDPPTVWLWLVPAGPATAEPPPDPETLRRLKALGYAG